MRGYPLDQYRGAVPGAGATDFTQQADAMRANRMTSPQRAAREYAPGTGSPNPAPRIDLGFNADSLRPFSGVPLDQLTFVADTMRYGDFSHVSINALAAGSQNPIITRAPNKRIYLMIQNIDLVNQLFIGFGVVPSSKIGITLNAGGSIIFDAVVPQDDIFVAASVDGTLGLLTYCNQAYGRG